MNKAVFLDRDGVINKRAPAHKYITKSSSFKLLPGVKQAIYILNQSEFMIIVITNQAGIAKKQMTETDLRTIHAKMNYEILGRGSWIDDIYVCPHHANEHCRCRKPGTALLERAAKEQNISLSQSWMVGDSETDIMAGKNAGCGTVFIGGGPCKPKPDFYLSSLLSAATTILSEEK